MKGHTGYCTVGIKFKICESYLGHAVMSPLFSISSWTTQCPLNRNRELLYLLGKKHQGEWRLDRQFSFLKK